MKVTTPYTTDITLQSDDEIILLIRSLYQVARDETARPEIRRFSVDLFDQLEKIHGNRLILGLKRDDCPTQYGYGVHESKYGKLSPNEVWHRDFKTKNTDRSDGVDEHS